MVLYDDKKWLCRLIRTAFTLEDDSGICENVLKERPYLGEDGDDSDSFSSDDSFEIREGADASHRRRSNTAIKLERLEKQRKVHIETQHVRVNPLEAGKNELGFTRDSTYLEKQKSRDSKIISIKSLLESVPHPKNVPFSTYARFEASCQPTASSKRIAIFLPFLPPKHRSYPVRIVILSTAKINDLIGLILWVTSQNHPGIELFPPHHYNLLIADEDGEWDSDFPPLDKDELVGKFQFSHLALLRSDNVLPDQPTSSKVSFSFLLPNGTTFQITLEEPDLTLGQLISLVLTKSGWSSNVLPSSSSSSSKNPSLGYHLEKLGDSSTKYTDLSLHINQVKCRDFCLVRDGAKSVQDGFAEFHGKNQTSNSEPTIRNLYPVTVSKGRFNKIKHALCVIWGDRIDLEYQNLKVKSCPLSSISNCSINAAKNRVVVTINQVSGASVGNHYLTTTNTLTLTTNELSIAVELYHRLNSMLSTKTK